ncbi:MAG: hypothetical protein EAX96_21160 [Candidatus Lokiarchaeota archaeon]|nr:hypothetical protein [Candidatus Lokiarchaeota archaeon]
MNYTLQDFIKLIKKSYLKGIEDCLEWILTDEVELTKVHQLDLEIKESKSLHFEDKVLGLTLE